jgi:hypothetical protein
MEASVRILANSLDELRAIRQVSRHHMGRCDPRSADCRENGFESANRGGSTLKMPRWLEMYQTPLAPLCTSDAFKKACSQYAAWLIRTLGI